MPNLKSLHFASIVALTVFTCSSLLLNAAPSQRPGSSDEPSTQGGRDKTEVQKFIRTNLKTIRNCYEEVLKQDPKVEGKLRVTFKITQAGQVSEANAQSVGNLPASLQDCTKSTIKSWVFPASRSSEPTVVTYPFTFRPN